jgi:hypothetical protein
MIGWTQTPEAVRVATEAIAAKVLKWLPGKKRGTTFIAKLVPDQSHPVHTDHEDNDCPTRVHVPVVTNGKAVYMEGDDALHMEAGFAWVIDPTQPHTAWNGGTEDRIHLMFNAVPDVASVTAESTELR